jgi:hypothetical protein
MRFDLSLIAACALPLACQSPAAAPNLSFGSGTTAHSPELAGPPPPPATDAAPGSDGTPAIAPEIDAEALRRFAAPLAPNFDPEPKAHPFTGPWQPLSRGLLESFLRTPEDAEAEDKEHWSGLPWMSDLAKENGIKLPEPFGPTATYFVIHRPSRVTKVKAGINNGVLRVSKYASLN